MKTEVINLETRKKLIELLPANYRNTIAERVKCHPNTVYNVLMNGTDNPVVVLELMLLAKENKEAKLKEITMRKKALAIMKQL